MRLGLLYGPAVYGITAAGIALPATAAGLHAEAAGVGWLLTGYALALGVGVFLWGRMCDRHGARAVLCAGAVTAAAGAAVCLTATAPGVLVAGRMVLAAGSAGLTCAALASAASNPDRTHLVMADVGAVVAGFAATATLVGAVVTAVSWRVALVLPVLSVAALAWAWPVTPPRRSGRPAPPDRPGAVLLTLAAAGLLLLPQQLRVGGTHAAAVAVAVLGAAGLLWRHIRQRPDGFLPRRLITDATFLAAAAAGAAVYAGLFAALRIVPSALIQQHSWDVLQVGVALLPGAATGAVLSRLTARGGHRHGRLLAGAAGAMAAAMAAAGLLDDPTSLLVAASVCLATVTAAQAVLTTLVSRRYPTGHRGTAIGLLNLGCFLGGALGTAAADISVTPIGPRPALAVVAVLPLLACLAANRVDGGRGRSEPANPATATQHPTTRAAR